MIEWGEL
jgi:hypothetical protein